MGLLVLSFSVVAAVVAYIINTRFTPQVGTMRPMTSDAATATVPTFSILSPAFQEGESIPSKFTCDEAGESPPLSFAGTPKNAKSLVLIVQDPDVPKEIKPDGIFVHWILFNISPTTTEITEGTSSGIEGVNGMGVPGYVAPCPPKEYQPNEHRYFFNLYALDTELSVPRGAAKGEILKAMEGHIIASAQLIGKYKKQ